MHAKQPLARQPLARPGGSGGGSGGGAATCTYPRTACPRIPPRPCPSPCCGPPGPCCRLAWRLRNPFCGICSLRRAFARLIELAAFPKTGFARRRGRRDLFAGQRTCHPLLPPSQASPCRAHNRLTFSSGLEDCRGGGGAGCMYPGRAQLGSVSARMRPAAPLFAPGQGCCVRYARAAGRAWWSAGAWASKDSHHVRPRAAPRRRGRVSLRQAFPAMSGGTNLHPGHPRPRGLAGQLQGGLHVCQSCHLAEAFRSCGGRMPHADPCRSTCPQFRTSLWLTTCVQGPNAIKRGAGRRGAAVCPPQASPCPAVEPGADTGGRSNRAAVKQRSGARGTEAGERGGHRAPK